jgi:hypothetical protein
MQIIQHPDQLIEQKDPIATALLKKYTVRMPNVYVSDIDAGFIIRYSEEQTARRKRNRKAIATGQSGNPIEIEEPDRGVRCLMLQRLRGWKLP